MRNNKQGRRTGFTLLEILVAFVILGLAAGAVMSAFGTGPLKVAQSENERRAVLVARSMMALVGNNIPLESGTRQGTMSDGMSWAIVMQPYDTGHGDNGNTPPPATMPYLISVHAAAGPKPDSSEAVVTSLRLKVLVPR